MNDFCSFSPCVWSFCERLMIVFLALVSFYPHDEMNQTWKNDEVGYIEELGNRKAKKGISRRRQGRDLVGQRYRHPPVVINVSWRERRRRDKRNWWKRRTEYRIYCRKKKIEYNNNKKKVLVFTTVVGGFFNCITPASAVRLIQSTRNTQTHSDNHSLPIQL